ncbi:mCG141824, partial [Mus musculus]
VTDSRPLGQEGATQGSRASWDLAVSQWSLCPRLRSSHELSTVVLSSSPSTQEDLTLEPRLALNSQQCCLSFLHAGLEVHRSKQPCRLPTDLSR